MNECGTISPITVLALKDGDEQAFKEVYDRFSARLYGNLLKLVKSADIARELLQEVFLKVWEKRSSIDPGKSFRAYLFRIAENAAYDFYRRAAKDKKLQAYLMTMPVEDADEMEESFFDQEHSLLLRQAIAALPPRRQQVFCLCKLDGKSYEEAAVQLGLSASTISDHIVKATRFIRSYCHTHHQLMLALCLTCGLPWSA